MNIKEVKEYNADGSLIYECTMGFLTESEEHWFEARVGPSGKSFIYIKHAAKYRVDGTVQWRLDYDKFGSVKPKIKYNLWDK